MPNEKSLESAEETEIQPEGTEEVTEGEEQEESGEEGGGGQPGGNPLYARLRILERENKLIANRFDDMINRLASPADEEPEEEEEEEVDFDVNPLQAIYKKQAKIEKRLDREAKKSKETTEQQQVRQILTVANEAIKDFAEEQEDYQQAIEYLAALEFEEALEDNPDMTHRQVDSMLLDDLNKKKMTWVRSGKNPGAELYKKAVRRGYGRNSTPATKREDARETIAAEKKRASAGTSIAKAAGRASEGRVNSSAIAKMTDLEYREWADRVQKERGGGKIKMRDLLHDKIRSH